MSLDVNARIDLGELHVLSIMMGTRTAQALLSVDHSHFGKVIKQMTSSFSLPAGGFRIHPASTMLLSLVAIGID